MDKKKMMAAAAHQALQNKKVISKDELLKRSRDRWEREHPGRSYAGEIAKTKEQISSFKPKEEKMTPQAMSDYQKRTGRGYWD